MGRWAAIVEIALQFLIGAGIVAVLLIMFNLDRLLAPEESELLVRVRLLRGVISLALPLVILFFLTGLRHTLARLLADRPDDDETARSVKYIWFTMIGFVLLIVGVDVSLIVESFSDISFR